MCSDLDLRMSLVSQVVRCEHFRKKKHIISQYWQLKYLWKPGCLPKNAEYHKKKCESVLSQQSQFREFPEPQKRYKTTRILRYTLKCIEEKKRGTKKFRLSQSDKTTEWQREKIHEWLTVTAFSEINNARCKKYAFS